MGLAEKLRGLLVCLLAVCLPGPACSSVEDFIAAADAELPHEYPVMAAVQGGLRPNLLSDVSLYNISMSSYLHSFFRQHGLAPKQTLRAIFWVDDSSYKGREDVLGKVLINLEGLALALQSEHAFLKISIRVNLGMADGYIKTMQECLQKQDCQYVVFIEDDWMFESSSILHSQNELAALFDEHLFVNYLRFNKRPNQAWVSDAPCTVEDQSVNIPVTRTGGFSNNPHMLRPSAMSHLFRLTNSPKHAFHNWGLECHFENRLLGLHSLCHAAVYGCLDQAQEGLLDCVHELTVRNPAHRCGYADYIHHTFRQSNDTSCPNNNGHQPSFGRCGLYLYGSRSHPPSCRHLLGSQINLTEFWQSQASQAVAW